MLPSNRTHHSSSSKFKIQIIIKRKTRLTIRIDFFRNASAIHFTQPQFVESHSRCYPDGCDCAKNWKLGSREKCHRVKTVNSRLTTCWLNDKDTGGRHVPPSAFMLIAPGPGKRQRDCNSRDSIAWTSTDLHILEQSKTARAAFTRTYLVTRSIFPIKK